MLSSYCRKMGTMDIRIGSSIPVICWVLCVLINNVRQVAPQTCQLGTDHEELTFVAVETNQNISILRRDSEALTPLYRMQRLFLSAVQPNPFPQELLRVLLSNTSSLETSQVVKYEAGYVTCAVITILFSIFMLVFGIIFCVFQSRQRRVLPCEGAICQPMPVFLALLITFCFLFAGLVCTFYLNQKTHEEVGAGVQDLTRTLRNFRFSVSSIPQAIGMVVSEFSVPKARVFADLQSFSPAINRTVNSKVNGEIRPLLERALQTARDLEAAAQAVVNMNLTLVDLQQRENSLMAALTNHKDNLLKTLSDASCNNCGEAASIVQSVQLSANLSQIPSISEYVDRLGNVRKINLPGIFQKALQAVNEMPNMVRTQTAASISDITIALNKTELSIISYAQNIPIYRFIDQTAAALKSFEDKTALYGQEVERYEYYRWVIGVVLCCVLLLITTCTLLGLLFEVVGLYLLQDPANIRRQRDGASFLLVGVYVSFIFSWLLAIFVFITFLIGGNVQTLLCKHWVNGDIYEFLDDPANLPNNINLKRQLGLRNNTNFTDMYKQCKQGAPVWDVLQVNTPVNLDSAFNITQYTAQLQGKIDNFTVNVAGLNMISSIAVKVLLDYNNSGIDEVPFNTIIAQIQRPLLTVDLVRVSQSLESLASNQSNATIRSQLENEARALRDLQNTTVREQEVDVTKLNTSLNLLAVKAPVLKVGINRTIQDIYTLKGPLLEGTIALLKNESRCLLNQAIGYFSQYIDWVKQTITGNIASCRSVSVTLDNSRLIICDHVTNPWNGFWFCLGWCTFLLIPNIILSIKSAQYITPKSRDNSPEKENLFPLTDSTDAGKRGSRPPDHEGN